MKNDVENYKETFCKMMQDQEKIKDLIKNTAKFQVGDCLIDPFWKGEEASKIIRIVEIKVEDNGNIKYIHEEPNNFSIRTSGIYFDTANQGKRFLPRMIKIDPLSGKDLEKLKELNILYKAGRESWDQLNKPCLNLNDKPFYDWVEMEEIRRMLLPLCIHDWQKISFEKEKYRCNRCGVELIAV